MSDPDSFTFSIPDPDASQHWRCQHKNIRVQHSTWILEYCPKGCDGEQMVDIVVACDSCGMVIHEQHTGHEGCKYGRN